MAFDQNMLRKNVADNGRALMLMSFAAGIYAHHQNIDGAGWLLLFSIWSVSFAYLGDFFMLKPEQFGAATACLGSSWLSGMLALASVFYLLVI